jgi:ribonucleoside-diphosphate reductase alpha chain
VLTFFDAESRRFDVEGYKHAIRLWTIVLEVSVLMASFPSENIARLSYKFRTLGLGYANLGAMLMQAGIPYDSAKGRAICGALTAILTGESYAASAEMAKELGAFPGYEENKADMLRVMRNHRRAAYDVTHNGAAKKSAGAYEKLPIEPVGIDESQFADNDPMAPRQLLGAARECWDRAYSLGERHGYRNAQTTVIAPTGTIGLLMDCDTTGVEPDFALVKFKKLAGGGYFKIANQSLPPALRSLNYSDEQVHEILRYVMGTLTLHDAPHVSYERLERLGFTAAGARQGRSLAARRVRNLLRLQPVDARRRRDEALRHPRGRVAAAHVQPAPQPRLHQASRSTRPTIVSAAAAPSRAPRTSRTSTCPSSTAPTAAASTASASSPSKATSA